jgi:hypothetical protein
VRRTLFAAALAAGVFAACGDSGDSGNGTSTDDLPATTTTTIDITPRVKTYLVTDRTHVQGPVDYPQQPPVGGNHAAIWQNCGFYTMPVPSERAVHAMEHGAVWITYRPDLPEAQVRALRPFAPANPYVLVSPWPDSSLPAPVVASAWGVQLTADSTSDPAIAAFVEEFANGPQTPEKGAPCSGGTNSTS